ncbi:heterokaryon incompatibility protein-domain-containing protein [Xylariaceae sp. FL1651]|nr:heterokaryon incompatibility protein-domain-containing protein [Xylariaceae sp. FL1651]
MIVYRPLDVARNEIRVLTLRKPDSNCPENEMTVECSLQHVSLDDYTDQYTRFLELDGSRQSPRDRCIFWDTVNSLYSPRGEGKPGTLFKEFSDKITSNLSNPSSYRDDSYRDTKRFRWGDFAALSYEWGDRCKTAEIVIDNKRVSVTKNLRDSLASLAQWWFRLEMDREPTRLWVDAICINQEDIDERNAQVKRMKDIYALASRVLVMLGPDVQSGGEVFRLMREYDKIIYSSSAPKEDIKALIKPDHREAWRAFAELAGRSYWTRLWIIQEVQLAGAASVICFGEHFCLLTTFFLAASTIEENIASFQKLLRPTESDSKLDYDQFLKGINRISGFLQLETFKFDGSPYADLMTLLDTGRRAKQQDLRDKIYGLIGLIEPEIQSRLVPDYRKPHLQIYHDFAIIVIMHTKKLDIIYQMAAKTTQPLHCPSWVPNWSLDMSAVDDFDLDTLTSQFYHGLNAAGDTLHIWENSSNAGHLHCRGFQVDRVRGLAYYIELGKEEDEHDNTVYNATSVESCETYGTRTSVTEAIWSALTLGQTAKLTPDARSFLYNIPFLADCDEELHPGYSAIFFFHDRNQDLLVAGEPLSSFFAPLSKRHTTLLTNPPPAELMLDAIMLPVMCRRFFTTERGCVGMAPRSTRIDDCVYILKGCKVPLVLRARDDGTYLVVGECFVEGMMNGEAIIDLEKGNFQESKVILS